MGAPMTVDELTTVEDAFRQQWLRLRAWAGDLDPAELRRPSPLEGWTVADLIAHLGRTMDALAAVQPTPPGTAPMALSEYVGAYPGRAHEIADITRELAATISDDPWAAVDRMAAAAFAQLTTLRDLARDPVVGARRGPILLSVLVISRVLERVVHADDLVRSLPDGPPAAGEAGPLHPPAVTLVSAALLDNAVDQAGECVERI
jgi:uncharacterized protein (TIGR03083 family)